MSDARAVAAKSMYEGGMSIAQVAERFGVSRQSMHGTLRRLGTNFRSRLRYGERNHFYRGGAKARDSAQNKLEKAVLRGRLTRPTTCERCGQEPPPFKDGRTAIQAHHHDYSKPLDVTWLCQPCHHAVHSESA
jgi:hypothetical protein